ncbi:CidB/LrgB family autolysis modulator [Photobacterium sp. BZF1]|uniref:CidB/LrgB family autolysis modulator n=1 Tax=Photobacterium rosenbergii TaxID=294936 RepID=A0A2T3NFR0_9GAMM|nr:MULTISPECIES: CidB/LrgB family autolysis modulator [Photobacterium]MBC7004872.1 CidB/LrgB family autolysis modulator [Photobacterium sp. BZF1]MBY5946042.1 CidB/LrgB family autolysis modulator [Photobacterium rosenbergii]PSW13390.1 CidB/LrgB family autolysis modulator [Photobacterium rosenbergii]
MIWLLTTLVVFYTARFISKHIQHPIVNPLLICLLVIIPLLMWLEVPYETYFEQNKWLNALLEPAVVALAFPLYEQLSQIRKKWKVIFSACLIGSVLSMITGAGIALALGADAQLTASILPKSVTTPIAMAVAEQVGGLPSVAAIMVIIAGLFGAVLGYPLFRLIGVKAPIAKGLTMGTVSHALGTAKAAEENYQEGAFSSLALVICGVITSILAPLLFPLIIAVFS